MYAMDTKVWPFLVSRNTLLGFRPLVVPGFIIDARLSFIIAGAAGGGLTEPGRVMYREVQTAQVGTIALVYRVIRAQKDFVDLAGDGVLTDIHGRAISLIEGFILPEVVANLAVTESDMQTVHRLVEPVFRRFWGEDLEPTPIEALDAFELERESETNPLLLLFPEEPLKPKPKGPLTTLSTNGERSTAAPFSLKILLLFLFVLLLLSAAFYILPHL